MQKLIQVAAALQQAIILCTRTRTPGKMQRADVMKTQNPEVIYTVITALTARFNKGKGYWEALAYAAMQTDSINPKAGRGNLSCFFAKYASKKTYIF